MKKAIESILYFDLNPLHPDKRGEDYYRPAYRELGTVNEAFDAHYQIAFNAPRVSTKVLYYERFINNAITTELNKLLTDEQLSGNIVLFYRKKLFDSVCGYLSDIKDIINKNDLDLDALLITKDYSKMLQQNECTFIFHYLILALIRCYMEFQQHFYSYIEEENKLVSIEDFFVQVLRWRMPSKVGIEEILHVEVNADEQPQKKNRKKAAAPVLSFKYQNKEGKRTDNISVFIDQLQDNGLVPKTQSKPSIKQLLTGEMVKTPIIWSGNLSDLPYLFKLLVNDKKVLKLPEGITIWQVVSACFIDESGKHFDKEKLRKQKDPTDKRKKMLQDVAKALM
jgi:hypothetical protein